VRAKMCNISTCACTKFNCPVLWYVEKHYRLALKPVECPTVCKATVSSWYEQNEQSRVRLLQPNGNYRWDL